MINSTNMLTKNNPRWPARNAQETVKVPGLGRAVVLAAAWLAGLVRRAGRRLFAMNDLEARWRGWQVTELAGGLGRQYRDARFAASPGGRPPETPRHGRAPAPHSPGAWDDHWNGPLDGAR